MAVSTQVKNFTNGSLVLNDGTPTTPLTHTVSYINADFSLSGLTGDTLNQVVAYTSRGKLKSLAYGERIFPQVSFTAQFTELTNAGGSLLDFLFQKGSAYSAAVSTRGSTSPIFTFDMVLTIEGTNFGDTADTVITIEDVAVSDISFSEGDPDTISFTGTVYGAINGVATELS